MGGSRCAGIESAVVVIGKTSALERFAIEAMGTESELKWLFEDFMAAGMGKEGTKFSVLGNRAWPAGDEDVLRSAM